MRAIAAVVLAALLAAAGAYAAEQPSLTDRFAAANQAYAAGDLDSAIDGYAALVSEGVEDADLYFNMGNAYFELGQLGRAVLWYERARRLDPRDDDVGDNLALTHSLLRDRQLVPARSGLKHALLFWHHRTTTAESVAIASGLYAFLCLLAICLIFRNEPRVSRMLRAASVASPGRLFGFTATQDVVLGMVVTAIAGALFAGSAAVKLRDERDRPRGVVVAEEVSVFSGPSRDATVQFKVHEGTAVSVRDAREGWIRVDLPGDLGGWIDAASLERI